MVGFINAHSEAGNGARWVNVERITNMYTNIVGQTVICLIDEEPIYTTVKLTDIAKHMEGLFNA